MNSEYEHILQQVKTGHIDNSFSIPNFIEKNYDRKFYLLYTLKNNEENTILDYILSKVTMISHFSYFFEKCLRDLSPTDAEFDCLIFREMVKKHINYRMKNVY